MNETTHQKMPATTCSLLGVQLIEASAGTGKTWTLSALFARLIVQRQLEVKQILAITFTKAAAAELRDRIRKRLVELKFFLEQDLATQAESVDVFSLYIKDWLEKNQQTEQGIQRLHNAITNFDEATITTINGFCQGELVEQALASGMPFESELLSDTAPLLHEIIQDYCRQQWRQAEPLLVSYFLSKDEFSLANLYQFVAGILHQGQARLIQPVFNVNSTLFEKKAQGFFAQTQHIWHQENNHIREIFNQSRHILNGNKYREASVPKWFTALDEAFANNFMHFMNHKEGQVALEKFSRSYIESALKKNSPDFPQHRFFQLADELFELSTKLSEQLKRHALAFKCQLLAHSQKALVERLYAQQAQSFDMQIKGLAHALSHSDTGADLAQSLRQKYPVALVDEFQDTDNYQYQILQHIYLQAAARQQNCALFLVGDPKQAIYRFRGADVYTYLKAYDAVGEQHRHHLDANQRSVAPLIGALNAFFALNKDAFKQDKIRYHPVVAGERSHAVLSDQPEAQPQNYQPLRFIAYAGQDKINKEQAREWAVNSTVAEIVQLLTGASRQEVLLGEQPLQAKDIVILVRAHFEAEACRFALAKVGIKAAMQSRSKVFATEEADDMARVLAAFAEPHNEGKVRAVLASRLCGATLSDLLAWQKNTKIWTQHLIRFQNYHKTWQQKGFIVAWREFLQQEGAAARIAHLPHGERILTNFLHLADLLHEEYRQRLGMRQLCEWFVQQRITPQESENAELRLESDENLIKIITIHQSKGLEFPVVFVPMLWSPPDFERGTPFYHQDEEAIFNLSDTIDDTIKLAVHNEVLSEELRLGYVALTRASQRCYVHWCPLETKESNVKQSALGHWLSDGMSSLHHLQQQNPQHIGLLIKELQPILPLFTPITTQPQLSVLTPPKVAWGYRLTSFSSLQQGAKALQTQEEVLEIKDDEGKEIVLEYEEQQVESARFNFAGKKTLASHAGNCLHKIFEHADFVKPVSEWHDNIHKQLKAHGIMTTWTDEVIQWLSEVMQARLLPDLRLSQLSHQHILRELDFHLPLSHFQTTQFRQCLQKHGIAVSELPYQSITGFLKGSIDLVFQHQGQYFIADYKSNYLGHQLDNYQTSHLSDSMQSHGYNLQAAIYALALHRWLASRLHDYQPQKHLGGVFYLYLRGMNPHGSEGIYHWQPSLSLLNEMSALLGDSV